MDGWTHLGQAQCARSTTQESVPCVAKTLESEPDGATHWIARSMAREAGSPQTAVSRIWRAFGLQPYPHAIFKLSSGSLHASLSQIIRHSIKINNDDPKPVAWSKAAGDILAGVECRRLRTLNSRHGCIGRRVQRGRVVSKRRHSSGPDRHADGECNATRAPRRSSPASAPHE